MNSKRKQAYKLTIERDNGMCQLCPNTANNVHHIIFRSRGGSDDVRNLICLCNDCHRAAHHRQKKYQMELIKLNERHYGTLTIKDLKKKGRYDDFRY